MLPIVSIEEWRMRRLRTQIHHLKMSRPLAFAVLERWVDRLCEAEDTRRIV
jgi:hypothetical protein